MRISDAFLRIEVIWSILCSLLVYILYLMNINQVLTWICLAFTCLPYPVRLARHRRLFSRTPFDIPIALLILGAIVGLCISPERAMSLGAFQCLLAIVITYYVLTVDEHPAFWMNVFVLLLLVAFLTTIILVLVKNPYVYTQTDTSAGHRDTNHGLALQLSIAAAILFGVALFARQSKGRILAAIAFLASATTTVAITWASLKSLVAGDSISGRLNQLWRPTVTLLSDHPLTGLGLGCWARTYYSGVMDLWSVPGFYEITHPHNAYLELYSSMGLPGAVAAVLTFIIGARLSLDIIRSPRSRPWYGLGIGLILACIVTALVGIVESAPVGAPHLAEHTYYYVICPIPCALCGFLVVTHRLITRGETG